MTTTTTKAWQTTPDGDIIEIIDMRGNQAGTSGSSLASALFGGRGFRGRNRAAASVDPKVDATRGCSTVSHFNAIHISCHLEAKRADINRRPPKREWEGATLRNAETLCNSVLPVWTSSDLRSSNVERTSTSDEEYEETTTIWSGGGCVVGQRGPSDANESPILRHASRSISRIYFRLRHLAG